MKCMKIVVEHVSKKWRKKYRNTRKRSVKNASQIARETKTTNNAKKLPKTKGNTDRWNCFNWKEIKEQTNKRLKKQKHWQKKRKICEKYENALEFTNQNVCVIWNGSSYKDKDWYPLHDCSTQTGEKTRATRTEEWSQKTNNCSKQWSTLKFSTAKCTACVCGTYYVLKWKFGKVRRKQTTEEYYFFRFGSATKKREQKSLAPA